MAVQELVGQRVVLTYRDYCALPNDGRRYEILEGDLHVSPAPSPFHQTVLVRLIALLHAHVEGRRLGRVLASPIDVLFADTTIVQPDVIFVAQDQWGIIEKKYIRGAPRLVVEVLSPWNAHYDAQAKRQLYAKFGVLHYWMVDIETPGVLELSDPRDGAYPAERRVQPPDAFEPKVFPGLRIDLGGLFAE